jgi:peptide subunit release factor 1 (eRF1)
MTITMDCSRCGEPMEATVEWERNGSRWYPICTDVEAACDCIHPSDDAEWSALEEAAEEEALNRGYHGPEA